jgi:multidrug efflux pump
MEALARKLPPGIGYEWTGLSFEEKASGGQAGGLYALSLLIVFLCLAALYESWSVPIAVLLVVPLGVVGAVLSAHLTHLNNDIYFQVALITTLLFLPDIWKTMSTRRSVSSCSSVFRPRTPS